MGGTTKELVITESELNDLNEIFKLARRATVDDETNLITVINFKKTFIDKILPFVEKNT